MAKPTLRLVAPITENCTVAPRRRKNADYRTCGHLVEGYEVDKLIEAAKTRRHGHRDALMVLLADRHGLRAAESTCAAGRLQNGHPVMSAGLKWDVG